MQILQSVHLSFRLSIYKSVHPVLSLPLWAVLNSRLPCCPSICLSIHLPVCPPKPLPCLSTCLSICLFLSNYYIWLSVVQLYCFDHTAVITEVILCKSEHFQAPSASIWFINMSVIMFLLSFFTLDFDRSYSLAGFSHSVF